MKLLKPIMIGSFVNSVLISALIYAEEFSLNDPSKGLFDKSTKIAQGFFSAEWMIKGGAGLFAISCFIAAGNLSRQGNYGRAVGAVVGGIITALGAYLVSLSQK